VPPPTGGSNTLTDGTVRNCSLSKLIGRLKRAPFGGRPMPRSRDMSNSAQSSLRQKPSVVLANPKSAQTRCEVGRPQDSGRQSLKFAGDHFRRRRVGLQLQAPLRRTSIPLLAERPTHLPPVLRWSFGMNARDASYLSAKCRPDVDDQFSARPRILRGAWVTAVNDFPITWDEALASWQATALRLQMSAGGKCRP
jgi:hypothetical protein